MASPRYRVTCYCGHVCEGKRRGRFEELRCPRCREKLLAFPAAKGVAFGSSASAASARHSAARPTGPRRWPLKPILFGSLLLAVLFTGAILLIVSKGKSTTDPKTSAEWRERWSEEEKAAQSMLADGAFTEAVNRLRDLTQKVERAKAGIPGEWLHRAQRLEVQAAALANLSPEPIPDFLRHARGLSDRGWSEEFAKRYRDKAFLFDTGVQLDAFGQVRIDFEPGDVDGPVRLDLSNNKTLPKFASREMRRYLFVLILKDAERGDGNWTLRFENEAILIADETVLRSLPLPVDGELQELITKQRELWETLRPR